MDVLEKIRSNQDLKAMNTRLIKNAIELYAEKTHFIYEILQNAEDAGATSVSFIQYYDRLEVLHDGNPFTESNLQSLCDAANSDKKEQEGKIGKFGIGFKSVFAICQTVMLYSEPKNRPLPDALPRIAIRIDNYIDPSRLDSEWNLSAPYTTKFVFPYDEGLYGRPKDALRLDLAQKLRGIGASVLLFMKNIKQIHYKVSGISWELDGESTYRLERTPMGSNYYKAVALGETGDRDCSYLVFTKPIYDSMHSVDIAFSTTEADGKIRFIKADSPYVSVYFPTETESRLNFLVQAPFDLTPNRSSLKKDSARNNELMKHVTELFCNTVLQLREMNLLTLELLDLLPLNAIGGTEWVFYNLAKSAEILTSKEKVIPTADGGYTSVANAKIARSSKLMDIFEGDRLCALLKQPDARWMPRGFTENGPRKHFYGYLKDIGVEEIVSNDIPRLLRQNPDFIKDTDETWLVKLYSFLSEDTPALLGINGDLALVPFIKTTSGIFGAPFISIKSGRNVKKEPNVFIRPLEAEEGDDGDMLFVADFITRHCQGFVEKMGLHEPDPFAYFVKEIKRAGNPDHNNIMRVKQAIGFLKDGKENAAEIFKEHLYLQVRYTNGTVAHSLPSARIYRENDCYGVSLMDYFSGVGGGILLLDEAYYSSAGISKADIGNLVQLGIRDSVYENLENFVWVGDNNANCRNKGNFRCLLNFTEIERVRAAIYEQRHSGQADVAKNKSAAVFKLLKNVEIHLKGQWQFRDTNPETRDDVSAIVNKLRSGTIWIFSKNGSLGSPSKMSRYDLDTQVYGEVDERSTLYDILGFRKTEADHRKELVDEFVKIYGEEKLRKFIECYVPEEETEDVFDPTVDETPEDFPKEPIKDLEKTQRSARRQYIEAPRVTYEQVRRRIRTSRGRDKEHIRYRYRGHCQMCETRSAYWEIAELHESPPKELEQMNLSLCPNCASEYRRLRSNKTIMAAFEVELRKKDPLCETKVAIGAKTIRFTSKHLAEIQTLLICEKQSEARALADSATHKR